MKATQSTKLADVRTHLTCALLLTLSAGCGGPVDATADGDVGSSTSVETGELQTLGFPPPPPCITCPRTLSVGPTPTGLAVTSSGVFWTGGGSFNNVATFGIFSAPLYGGSVSLFYDSPVWGIPPNSLVAADGAFYWQQPDGLSAPSGTWAIFQSGGTATQLQEIWDLTAQQVQGVAVKLTTETLGGVPLQFKNIVSSDPDNNHLWKFSNSTLHPALTTTMLLDNSAEDLTGPQFGDYYPDSVTLDAVNVYFVSYRTGVDAVYQMSLTGGTPPLFLGFADVGSPIAVYGSYVYFVREDSIARVPVGGGQQITFATRETGAPTSFAVDAGTGTLYWTCTTCGTVSKQSFASNSTVTLASGEAAPKFIAVDSTNVYWGATNSVRSRSK